MSNMFRMNKFKRFGVILGFVCLAAAAFSAPARAQEQTLGRQLLSEVRAYEKASGATVGLLAVDLDVDETLAAVRQGRLFTPASNQKILTSAFALAKLGADFEFVTKVELDGDVLSIVGDYDPTLGDPFLAEQNEHGIYDELDRWAGEVKERLGDGTISRISVIPAADDPGEYRHPDWPKNQYKRWYAAPVAAVNFHDNCIDVSFEVEGDKVTPVLRPHSRYIEVINRVRKGGKHVWGLSFGPNDATVTLRGTVSRTTPDPYSVSVNDPPRLLGHVFADRLAGAGVEFASNNKNAATQAGKPETICKTVTPIAAVIKRANKRSLNLAAECLMLRAGGGTWDGGAKIMTKTLAREYGVDEDSLIVRDGSGLSRKNRVTPAAMVKVLTALADGDNARLFLDSLAISGTDGTLDDRLPMEPYRGRVLGKTGYVYGASCLSGYVLDDDGDPAVAFSIMVKDVRAGRAWKAKRLQDDLCRILVDYLIK